MKFVKRNKTLSAVAAASVLGILAWLAFGFFGIQAAFIDNVVDEDGPVFAVAAPVAEEPAAVPTTAPLAVPASMPEDSANAADEVQVTEPAAPAPVDTTVDTTEPAAEPAAQPEVATETQPTAVPAPAEVVEPTSIPEPTAVPRPTAIPTPEPATPGEVVTLFGGQFQSLNDYSVDGNVTVLGNGTEQRFLRFENFTSDNGPDLKVYLRAANGEFISLGDLSGNIGNQNYEIPAGVDLNVFSSVEIWCERFNSGFGTAGLVAS